MIQELLGGVVAVEERKMSLPGPVVVDTSPTTSVISSPASPTPPENLCCPRCDSPNTKFCYYNNYNLTQPRHFCKTCRRYWTKGGALRNVPIGGGCRKMKAAASVISPSIAIGKSGGCKPTRPVADQVGTGGDHEFSLDLLPSLWGSCSMPHSSQLLALLRASQMQQNPNMHNYHIVADALDPLGQVCNNSSFLWKNDSKYQYQQQNQNQNQNQNHFTPTGSGIQDLYQRLRAPANCGGNDNIQLFSNNFGSGSCSSATATMATTTTTTGSILEPLPLFSGGELGYWNPAMSWAELPMPNGAFP